jgi:hypothetical protein
MALEKELETYLAHRPAWLQEGRLGQWVLIHGDEVVGFYENFDATAQAGYERFGLNTPFMARQIAESEKVIQSSRRAVHVPHNH